MGVFFTHLEIGVTLLIFFVYNGQISVALAEILKSCKNEQHEFMSNMICEK